MHNNGECIDMQEFDIAQHAERLKHFNILHSQIIQFFQCIEFEMRRIYSVLSKDVFFDSMKELSDKNWGTLLRKLRDLNNSMDEPVFKKDSFELLDTFRERRNYWCHQCFLDFVYISDNVAMDDKLQQIVQRLELDHEYALELQELMEGIYFSYFKPRLDLGCNNIGN